MFAADVKLNTLPVAESASGRGIIFAGTGVTVISGAPDGGEVTAELCPHLTDIKEVNKMIRTIPTGLKPMECFFKLMLPLF